MVAYIHGILLMAAYHQILLSILQDLIESVFARRTRL
jgi:hypothetical protein